MQPQPSHSGREAEAPRPAPPPAPPRRTPPPSRPGAPGGGVRAAREAVRGFLLGECQAREVRITRLGPLAGSEGGWQAEAEILVPDLTIKMLGLPLTQEVLERQYCTIALDPLLGVTAYELVDPDDR
jgi:hypothetical protein